MNKFEQKWGIVLKAAGIVIVLLLVRLAIDTFGLDLITVNTVVGSFVGGAIFTLAIILTGTLVDFKEAEKIPAELAGAFKNVYQDARLIQVGDTRTVRAVQEHAQRLLAVINSNFKGNRWDSREITGAIDLLNDDIAALAMQNVPPQFLVKLRAEVSAIERLTNRVQVIARTSFIPAAYAIAELATVGVLIVLLFIKLDPYYEGLVIFFVIAVTIIGLLLLIKDMDDPFEYGAHAYADVDFTILFEMENYFLEKEGIPGPEH
ncbi:hypothetical protein J2741_001550 [Methanolinea mesophila]|uniref:hypothetical protein n=1 Tax=Methanolinea mesophila TaxID=547055 RepID=UPI001AE90E45|nr:hypothetical protein [Methanolinea mesophila]MBP1929003.1 hypothetical protein [Methanolinea mesophila]